MKKRGHYCKVCGAYKANEKFSGRGDAAHICKTCAALPPEKQAEENPFKRFVKDDAKPDESKVSEDVARVRGEGKSDDKK